MRHVSFGSGTGKGDHVVARPLKRQSSGRAQHSTG
jgi:hypothetical protein